MVSAVEIREATPQDWPQIWPFFSAIVRAQETYAYDPDMTSDEARAVWMSPAPDHTVVATSDGDVVATAKMGPNRPGPGAHIGTASFMVAPEAGGHGVGRALGEYTVEWHRANGYRGIQFNAVVETNTAAVHLWRALGFEVVGTVPGAFRHPDHGYVGLCVMFLPLA
jgi:L-amino acid N-acyltransferase YncA